MEPIINLIFPEHLIGVKYVYILLPGLMILLLSTPIGLIYNASLRLTPMLMAYLISVLINAVTLYIFWRTNTFNLENIAILKSALCVFISVFFCSSYLIMRKRIWE